MKTIQQTLKELDTEKVINYYFAKYPVNLFKNIGEKWDGYTVAECKAKMHDTVKGLIERVINTKPNPSLEKESILFAYKCIGDELCEDIDMGLLDIDDLLKADDVSEVKIYAYYYERLEDTVGYYVADTTLTQNNLLDIVTSFLYETSFFGFEQENLEKERKHLDDALKECEDASKKLSFTTVEELFNELGVKPDEKYPEEKEKMVAYNRAACEYNKYCREIELEKIKEALGKGE